MRFIGSLPVYSRAPLITNGSGRTNLRTGISPMKTSLDIPPASMSAGTGSTRTCWFSFITLADLTSPKRSLTVSEISSTVNIPRFSQRTRHVLRHFCRPRSVNIPEISPFCAPSFDAASPP